MCFVRLMEAVPTAPPPADAKTGSAINPVWKQVFPLTVPDHGGQPPTGLFVGFGDPTGAIGTLKSMASTYPVRMAVPTWQA